MAAYRPGGPEPTLVTQAEGRTLTTDDVIDFLKSLSWVERRAVVVLDNASIHTSEAAKARRKELKKLGIDLYFLPPYSPKMNRAEAVFRQVKHVEVPTRSFASKEELQRAAEAGFESYRKKLAAKHQT